MSYGDDNLFAEPDDLIIGWVVCFLVNCSCLSVGNLGTAWHSKHHSVDTLT